MIKRGPIPYCLGFILLALSACSSPKGEAKRYFWPPPPTQPKIEYINFYLAREDIDPRSEDYWVDLIFGLERPKAMFERPACIAAGGNGKVFVSDTILRKVVVLDFAGRQIRNLRNANGDDQIFKAVNGIAVDETGSVYVVDSLEHQIYVFDREERIVGSFGTDLLNRPTGIAYDPRHQLFYVVDTGAHAIVVFNGAGGYLRTLGKRGTGPGEFNFPLDADVDAEGNLYVLDSLNARVQVFTPQGEFLRAFGERGTAIGSFQIPKGIAVSPSGLVMVTDAQGHRFVIFDLQGEYLLTVGGESAMVNGKIAPGGFYMPHDIDVDPHDAIWVVDTLNRMVHRFQVLNPEYLKENPIRPGEAVQPVPPAAPEFQPGQDQ